MTASDPKRTLTLQKPVLRIATMDMVYVYVGALTLFTVVTISVAVIYCLRASAAMPPQPLLDKIIIGVFFLLCAGVASFVIYEALAAGETFIGRNPVRGHFVNTSDNPSGFWEGLFGWYLLAWVFLTGALFTLLRRAAKSDDQERL